MSVRSRSSRGSDVVEVVVLWSSSWWTLSFRSSGFTVSGFHGGRRKILSYPHGRRPCRCTAPASRTENSRRGSASRRERVGEHVNGDGHGALGSAFMTGASGFTTGNGIRLHVGDGELIGETRRRTHKQQQPTTCRGNAWAREASTAAGGACTWG